MARFAVTISMPHSEYATGESIPLTATVKNLSDAVAAVPASSAPSPFVYQIKSLEARNPSLVLSESRQMEMTSPGTPQTPAYVALFSLGPNQSSARREDLRYLAARPIPPGRYEVTAQFSWKGDAAESAPLPFRILAPKFAGISSAGSTEAATRVLAGVAQIGDSAGVPLVQEAPFAKPPNGMFGRLEKPDVSQLCPSVDAEPAPGIRWYGWLSGNSAGASKVESSGRVRHYGPLPVEMESPLAISPGFQFGDGSFLLLVAGREQSQTKLRAYRFPEGGLAWEASMTAGEPGRMAARYPGDGSIEVYWLPELQGKGRVVRGVWRLSDGHQVEVPGTLMELGTPVVAWEVPPTGVEKAARVHIVTGPAVDGRYACLRFPLNRGAGRLPTLAIPAPPSTFQHWAVKGAAAGDVVVAGATAEGLYQLRLPSPGQWTAFVTPAAVAGFFSLAGTRSVIWAEWLDPEFGLRAAKVVSR